MSTKIYHGLKINVASLAELATWKREVCTRFETEAVPKMAKALAESAIGIADSLQILPRWGVPKPTPPTEYGGTSTPLKTAHYKLEKGLKESPGHCERDNYILEMSLFPLENENFMLALVHNSPHEVEAWIKTQPKVEAFPYWNNCDAPKDITSEEWDERGALWGSVLKNTPARDGLLMETQNPENMLWSFAWDRKKYPFQAPDKKTRARRLARIILEHKMFSAMTGPNVTGSQIMRVVERVAKHPGKKNLARIIERQLPTYYRWEDITKIKMETKKEDERK